MNLFVRKMIARELKREWRALAASLVAITIGVSIIASLGSLRSLVIEELAKEERAIAGSDLSLSLRGKASTELEQLARDIPGERVTEITFPSMLASETATRLVQVQGLSGAFPFYGKREVSPPESRTAYLDGQSVLIEKPLAIQLAVSVGDRVQLGEREFTVAGITGRPQGETNFRMTIAPKVVVLLDALGRAGLLTHGIRQETIYHYRLPAGIVAETVATNLSIQARELSASFDTPSSRREQLGESVSKVYSYLNLFAIATIVVGALGAVAGGSYYAGKKQRAVATLRCIGASTKELVRIYAYTLLVAALMFSLLGVAISVPLLYFLRDAFSDYLPASLPALLLPQPEVVFLSSLVGILAPLLFALPPIISLKNVSPLEALREESKRGATRKNFSLGVLLGAAALLLGLSSLFGEADKLLLALSGALVVLVSLQFVFSSATKLLTRRLVHSELRFSLKHGLASAGRPGSEAVFISVLVGAPLFLALSLSILSDTLSNELDSLINGSKDNVLLFDIQSTQKNAVLQTAKDFDVTITRWFPLVSMRLSEINGEPTADILLRTENRRSRWFLTREFKNTYRNDLLDNELLLEGEMPATSSSDLDIVPVTVEERMIERLSLQLGDKLSFNVQGLPIDTEIVGIRDFNFRSINPGFFVVFPEGVLEEAPHMNVATAQLEDLERLAAFQTALAKAVPNVSLIDSRVVRDTLSRILGRLQAVVEILGSLFVFASILVILTTIQLSSAERLSLHELYLKLGATRRTLALMTFYEFLVVGLMGAGVAAIVAALFTYVSGSMLLDIRAKLSFTSLVLVPALVALGVAMLGALGVRLARALH